MMETQKSTTYASSCAITASQALRIKQRRKVLCLFGPSEFSVLIARWAKLPLSSELLSD